MCGYLWFSLHHIAKQHIALLAPAYAGAFLFGLPYSKKALACGGAIA